MSFPEGGRIVDLVKKKKPGTRYPTNRHVDGLKKLPLRATDVLVLLCPLARRNKKKKNAGLKEKKNTGKTVRGGRFRTVTIRRIKKKPWIIRAENETPRLGVRARRSQLFRRVIIIVTRGAGRYTRRDLLGHRRRAAGSGRIILYALVPAEVSAAKNTL